MNHVKALCEAYLQALNDSDLDKVISLFTSDGVVDSPLYGETQASDFYKDLFANTMQSETSLLNVFLPSNEANSVALHFNYVWTLQSGEIVNFECVDVFYLSEDQQQFTRLKIIYDTHPLRKAHSDSQQLSQ